MSGNNDIPATKRPKSFYPFKDLLFVVSASG
jgi:hypothetical protein